MAAGRRSGVAVTRAGRGLRALERAISLQRVLQLGVDLAAVLAMRHQHRLLANEFVVLGGDGAREVGRYPLARQFGFAGLAQQADQTLAQAADAELGSLDGVVEQSDAAAE